MGQAPADVAAPKAPYVGSGPPQHHAQNDDMGRVAGIPQGRPPWLIAVVVGVAALVVGGGIALIALR